MTELGENLFYEEVHSHAITFLIKYLSKTFILLVRQSINCEAPVQSHAKEVNTSLSLTIPTGQFWVHD